MEKSSVFSDQRGKNAQTFGHKIVQYCTKIAFFSIIVGFRNFFAVVPSTRTTSRRTLWLRKYCSKKRPGETSRRTNSTVSWCDVSIPSLGYRRIVNATVESLFYFLPQGKTLLH